MNLSTSHRAVYLLIFAFRMRIVILQSISILKSRVRTIFGKNYFVNKSCGLVLPAWFWDCENIKMIFRAVGTGGEGAKNSKAF